ncbi:hypothetical protein N7541_005299 [Penicillium brevicompactum]|uniref:Uncharacterized protein n=1 Tax=Penicillium brevicompactum TaxID=5074 RepID=A0A9W9RDG4_PENBR|nr:hypothetical protein N7541_005299 [Penicillium brevicompactum]
MELRVKLQQLLLPPFISQEARNIKSPLIYVTFAVRDVFEAIMRRQGSISITERVFQAAVANNSEALLIWMFKRMSESFVTEFWKKTWLDANLTREVRLNLLGVFFERINSNLTDAMLEDYPYDRDKKTNYELDELINVFFSRHSFPVINITDRLVEILMERCGEKSIALFLKHHPTPITANLEQAAARNPIADMEALTGLLESQKKRSMAIQNAARISLSG